MSGNLIEFCLELPMNLVQTLVYSYFSQRYLNNVKSDKISWWSGQLYNFHMNHTVPTSESFKLAVYLQEARSSIFLPYKAEWVKLSCLCMSEEKGKVRNHNSYACCGTYRSQYWARAEALLLPGFDALGWDCDLMMLFASESSCIQRYAQKTQRRKE